MRLDVDYSVGRAVPEADAREQITRAEKFLALAEERFRIG